MNTELLNKKIGEIDIVALAKDWLKNEADVEEIAVLLHNLGVKCRIFDALKRHGSNCQKNTQCSMDALLMDLRLQLLINRVTEEKKKPKQEQQWVSSNYFTNMSYETAQLAELGFPAFQFAYSIASFEEAETEEDLAKAYRLVERAATQEFPPALFLWGVFLIKGLGGQKDNVKGEMFIQKAYEDMYLYAFAMSSGLALLADDQTREFEYLFNAFETGTMKAMLMQPEISDTLLASGLNTSVFINDIEEKYNKIKTSGQEGEFDENDRERWSAMEEGLAEGFEHTFRFQYFPPLEWFSQFSKVISWSEGVTNKDYKVKEDKINTKVLDVIVSVLAKEYSYFLQLIFGIIANNCAESNDFASSQKFMAFSLDVFAAAPIRDLLEPPVWASDKLKSHYSAFGLHLKGINLVLEGCIKNALKANKLNDAFWRSRSYGVNKTYSQVLKVNVPSVINDVKNAELKKTNKELRQKEQELEEMMAMFAHKFRSPLDAIIYNISHSNNTAIYERHAQTMRGLLDIFSIISTDQDVLVSKLSKDISGTGTLQNLLVKVIDMVLLHLLTESGSDKIHQHFFFHAKKTDIVAHSIDAADWYNDHYELEEELRVAWQREYAKLVETSNSLEDRLRWIEQYFFKLEVTGFDGSIRFKEYGVTESFLVIVINEILTNLFKYYSSAKDISAQLRWLALDGYQIIKCSNPSVKRERLEDKGSYKGHQFLSAIAGKTGSKFEKPEMQDNFNLEFSIPDNILIKGEAE